MYTEEEGGRPPPPIMMTFLSPLLFAAGYSRHSFFFRMVHVWGREGGGAGTCSYLGEGALPPLVSPFPPPQERHFALCLSSVFLPFVKDCAKENLLYLPASCFNYFKSLL